MDNVTRLLMQGAAGAAGGGTYVDDVFSTYLWRGNETARTIPTGVDNTKGALAWVKSRNDTHQHHLVDTERGSNKVIYSDTHIAESTIANRITGFTNNGFNVGSAGQVNGTNAYEYVGWNFRKAKGFFDIVTWTGNATNSSSPPRQIAHNLGSIPGAIWVKCLTANQSWACYHKSLGATRYMHLSDDGAGGTSAAWWNNTEPTSTHFTVGYDGQVNENNQQYVAYIFAGGESTADAARSVDFDGSGDYLTQTCDTVLRNWWDQAFTVEYWVNADGFVSSGNGGPGVLGVCAPTSNGETWSFGPKSNGTVEFYYWNGSIQQVTTTKTLNLGQWYHLAMVYDGSSSIKIYINGILEKSATVQGTPTGSSTVFSIGKIANGSEFNGRVSNVRITHQALYTSSFRPLTEPFTTTSQGATGSNVKLLCCNNSSTTGSTVTPETITANGDPTASIDSPFDDPAGFKFGEGGDQNIIKTGSYKGTGSTGIEVNIGFEPQLILVKAAASGENWEIYDPMRGIVDGLNQSDRRLRPNTSSSEDDNPGFFSLRPNGFIVNGTSGSVNSNGVTFIFLAIRRPDSYVGKPPEAGTDVFAMDTGSNSSTIPNFDSGFPVDFAFMKTPASSGDWYTGSRTLGERYLKTNSDAADADWGGGFDWDSNVGWLKSAAVSAWQSWMWKRHAGFDVVTWSGDGVSGRQMPHSMGKTPEMMWVKRRNSNDDWTVYHYGQNGGTNPEQYRLRLNSTVMNYTGTSYWNNTAPTSTHFTLGNDGTVNSGGTTIYIGMLFASANDADGNPISKVGYYTGNGSTTGPVITTGFAPRLIIIKAATTSGGWFLYDTVRGLASGNDQRIQLENASAQYAGSDDVDPNSTGFQLKTDWDNLNGTGSTYIYYAHA